MLKNLSIAGLLCLFSTAAVANETSVTIYSTATPGSINPDMYRPTLSSAGGGWHNYSQIPGYAVVKEKRRVSLDSGNTDVKFTDVAAFIDPTTVTFKSLTSPQTTNVLEQNFHFDLVSNQKLIEKFIDKEITVEQNQGNKISSTRGTLLSSSGGLVLKGQDDNIMTLNNYSNIRFPKLPEGLITKPTLFWKVNARSGGNHQIEASYQTTGITWWADYIANYKEGANANSGSLDLSAWVSIINKAGASFNNSKLKLVAGDVNRAKPQYRHSKSRRAYNTMALESADAGFQEKSFFEYHMYTLGRSVDIPNNSTKQIELFPVAMDVPVEKEYIYYSASQPFYGHTVTNKAELSSNKKVDVFLKFKNSKDQNLGIPLPSGRIRVNQIDTADDSMEFVGEDIIDHTPKDEGIRIRMGNAFDIVGERQQTDFYIDHSRKIMEETIKIKVKNRKDVPVEVMVKESLYRAANWKLKNVSNKYDKNNAFLITFPLEIPAGREEVINYTVRYSW